MIQYPDAGPRSPPPGLRKRVRRLLPWLFLVLGFVVLATGCARIAKPQGWAGPVVGGDSLYVSIANGKMAALKPDDMSVKWVFPPNTDEGKKLNLEGIYGAPVVAEGSVYFGAYDGYVYALNASDGSMRWAFHTGGPIVSGVSAKTGGTVAAPALDTLYFGSEDGYVYAVDKDGKLKWQFKTGDAVWTTPLVSDSVYVASVGGNLYSLDPQTGAQHWAFHSSAALLSDPVMADKSTILIGGVDKTLYAIDASTGNQKCSFGAGNWFWGKPLVDNGTIYVPNLDHNVYALDLSSCGPGWRESWKFPATDAVRSSPILVDNVLIVVDSAGNVFGIDPKNGQQAWGSPALLAKTVLADPIVLNATTSTQKEVLIVAQGGGIFTLDPKVGSTRLVQVNS